MTSVLAAVFLTSLKIVVGLLTGNLVILAEAAQSGLDLVAAGVTYVAVRFSGRPADAEHTYGYGKVWNAFCAQKLITWGKSSSTPSQTTRKIFSPRS